MLGYFVAMAGVDEMHLLNITVAPQRAGPRPRAAACSMRWWRLCRARGAAQLWLEVRAEQRSARAPSTCAAASSQVGVRQGYYPAPQGQREDAVVMSLAIAARGRRMALD